MSTDHQAQFPGFPEENVTWQFPNILNGYVHTLSGAEFKVLWYIVRHTYGWQKEIDFISITQFQNGITKRDGTILDKGTGISRPHIIKSLKTLNKRGFITTIEPTSGKGYIKGYKIRFSNDPFTMTLMEFLYKRENGKCFYCGVELFTGESTSIPDENERWMQIDHLTSRLYYGSFANNIVASCKKCNLLKGKLSAEEFLKKMNKPVGWLNNLTRGSNISLLGGSKKRLPTIYKNTISNNNIDNTNVLSTKSDFGSPSINECSSYFLQVMGIPKEDCSYKEGRRYWHLLLQESKTGILGVKWLVDIAHADDFFKNNITSSKDLYYKRVKLIARKRGNVPSVAIMGGGISDAVAIDNRNKQVLSDNRGEGFLPK